jgi:putative ABC transport system permease protein
MNRPRQPLPRLRPWSGHAAPAGLRPTRLGLRDLTDEALAGVLQRPGRSALTTLGTVLGVATFVAVLGLTTTASSQISERFSELRATEVVLEDTSPNSDLAGPAFPGDAEERLDGLNGVEAAGVLWQPPLRNPLTSAMSPHAGVPVDSEQLAVLAASPGALAAMHARTARGRIYDRFHEQRAERVVVLGAAAARRLGITRLDAQPTIFVAGTPLTVVGIVDHVDRQADALLAVLLPSRTAAALWGPPAGGEPARMLVETRLGAADLVGRQAPVALRPDAPERIKAIVPPDPHSLHDRVTSDLRVLFLLLATVCLLIGAVGIANTALVSVLERVPEIGVRRALGARRRHIAAQFLAESAGLGTLGGLIGTGVGLATVVAVAWARSWTAVIEPATVLPAPLVGTTIGMVAGLYPAHRATRVQPVEALQR